MSALKKVQISKDWWKEKPQRTGSTRKISKFEKFEVVRSDDLPELLTMQRAAHILGVHYQTIRDYKDSGELKFVKKGGRWVTTPEWIADYLNNLESND